MGEVSLAESAEAARVPYPTWRRYVERWHRLGVKGVDRVPARARGGRRYVISASIAERYLAGDKIA